MRRLIYYGIFAVTIIAMHFALSVFVFLHHLRITKGGNGGPVESVIIKSSFAFLTFPGIQIFGDSFYAVLFNGAMWSCLILLPIFLIRKRRIQG